MQLVKQILLPALACLLLASGFAQPTATPGAAQFSHYLNLLKGKRVAIFANQTSMVGDAHIVDILLQKDVRIVKIFSPEHGFRGNADAGEKVGNSTDEKTGLPIVSLYGSHKKPTAGDLQDVDVMIFDIQDVGVRYYTFISSLEYYIESAIMHSKLLIVLDRPNPNGHYVDGPVLEKPFRSFVGMQPVPVVYGMTIGEYAQLLVGERWLDSAANAKLAAQYGQQKRSGFRMRVVPCANYTHKTRYELPVAPSPNLRNMGSIYAYPSTCFFEGTVLSEGRGTDKPFEIFGHPSLPKDMYAFTPQPNTGAKNPKLNGQLCYGWNLSEITADTLPPGLHRIDLRWIREAWRLFPDKANFFLKPSKKDPKPEDYFFNKLAGNATLMQQIKDGVPEAAIRKSWEPALSRFKQIRKKYLLYKDF
jgi:uncharacterized protein YbbC (DUF1343 family)